MVRLVPEDDAAQLTADGAGRGLVTPDRVVRLPFAGTLHQVLVVLTGYLPIARGVRSTYMADL